MSTLSFYRAQAVTQQAAADATTIEKSRLRYQEASDSWAVFADGVEKRAKLRVRLAIARTMADLSENPDRGMAVR